MIRLGYVTNSSSTQHIIAWQGKKKDIKKLLKKHAEIFPETTFFPDISRDDIRKFVTKDMKRSSRKINSMKDHKDLIIDYMNVDENDDKGMERIHQLMKKNHIASSEYFDDDGSHIGRLLGYSRNGILHCDDDMIYIVINHH